MHIENNGNKIKHLRKDTLKLNYPFFKGRNIGYQIKLKADVVL